MANEGGVSSVVSPFAQVRDAGNLLTRADFAMPTVDLDTFKLQYDCPTEVIRHLRASGESNAVLHRQTSLKRSTALAASAIYKSMFGEEIDGKLSYPATYHVVYMTGWSPHESQQRPKERGSATVSFQDLASGLVANEDGVIAGDSSGVLTPRGKEAGKTAP
jgi:NADH dehydrogenase [ubiquinone] 1 alpha subcomplex assembly factor 5